MWCNAVFANMANANISELHYILFWHFYQNMAHLGGSSFLALTSDFRGKLNAAIELIIVIFLPSHPFTVEEGKYHITNCHILLVKWHNNKEKKVNIAGVSLPVPITSLDNTTILMVWCVVSALAPLFCGHSSTRKRNAAPGHWKRTFLKTPARVNIFKNEFLACDIGACAVISAYWKLFQASDWPACYVYMFTVEIILPPLWHALDNAS